MEVMGKKRMELTARNTLQLLFCSLVIKEEIG